MSHSNRKIRVLIVSHNAFHPQRNMGRTLLSLFKSWEPENLAQLYFYNEYPETDPSVRCFRVTDFDALKSIIGRGHAGPVSAEYESDRTEISKNQRAVYELARKRKAYQYVARNLIWKLSRWKTPELEKWVKDFSPDAIFFACGGYSFAYEIADQLGRNLQIPVIPYFCDDYYFLNKHDKSFLYPLVRRDIRKHIKEIIDRAPTYVCICDKMEREYAKEFGKAGTVIMTGAREQPDRIVPAKKNFSDKDPFVICYIGRLGLGRDSALVELGRAIRKSGLPIILHVYTTETSPSYLRNLIPENGIIYKGALKENKIYSVIRQSDAVLHVECMEPAMIEKTRYSISTKIADILASGVCAVVYGPVEAASISYLMDNSLAIVISDIEQVSAKLEQLLSARVREAFAQRALHVAKKNHDSEANSKYLYEVIANSCSPLHVQERK